MNQTINNTTNENKITKVAAYFCYYADPTNPSKQYDEQYEYYKGYYENYGYPFTSFDDFVIQYLGLDKDADWKAETLANSQLDVLQNLVSHAIAQQEGIEVTAEDRQDAIDYYMEYYKNYGQKVTEEELIEAVGERLLNEYALFEKVNKFLVDNCTISYED